MILHQIWKAKKDDGPWFDASVPGNVQRDYARAMGFGDVNYGENYRQYYELEPATWTYHTEFSHTQKQGESLFFVSKGIDYIFDIFLNGTLLHHQEGMFTKVELDLTSSVKETNVLEVVIYPHPKREGAIKDDRMEASDSCKPPVSYGWDWHPRLLPSGLWDDTYLETRAQDYIQNCELSYRLDDNLQGATVHVSYTCAATPLIELFDGDTCVYRGTGRTFRVENVKLWWCNGQGEPHLYHWQATTEGHQVSGTIGFRKIQLVMNEHGWDYPSIHPMSRSNPPITIELNGRTVFAKGSNWVNPEIFTGTITPETYRPLIQLAVEAHMNIFRCWGGALVNKDAFYDQCDQAGIMVWQEFPLACNNYDNDAHYLPILEQEAISIVTRLRRHACLVLWCGGNELFNSWSGMTDQSLALRLLNKICYEYDRDTPFLMTSPLMGMAHGGYTFFDPKTGRDVYQASQASSNTAYTEFGVPGISPVDYLKTFIPEEELFPLREGTAWESHHGLNAFGPTRWACQEDIEMYFGPMETLEQLVEHSTLMQCEGYKAIFEEARRQKNECSMAINWCYSEPWKTAANNSIVSYPALPKPAYYAVADALRPVLASARIPKFSWTEGETFTAELWLLNDSPQSAQDQITVSIEIDSIMYHCLDWATGEAAPNCNKVGHRIQFVLPSMEGNRFTLHLQSAKGYGSQYTLCYRPKERKIKTRQMNV